MSNQRKLLAIVEQGGYPNFTRLYQSCGFKVTMLHAMRQALTYARKDPPDVIVAEFNYQSDFRDRRITSYNVCYTKLLRGHQILLFQGLLTLGIVATHRCYDGQGGSRGLAPNLSTFQDFFRQKNFWKSYNFV